MTRVMYFESNRSSPEGMLAVGTVVMNRVESKQYPDTVCGVVGQKNQFAPGVLTKRMEKGVKLASRMASKVLDGGRHRYVREAKFFHTAGMTFPYTNMHYLVEAGGNVFYEKRKNARRSYDPPFRNPPALDQANRAARAMLSGYATSEPQRLANTSPATARFEQHLSPSTELVSPRESVRSDVSLKPITIDDVLRANGGGF
ncbi:cell wall hydrolase [Jiella marina]